MPNPYGESDVAHTRAGGKRGEVREFCITCETFGHSAENCDVQETF
jgi:hypothetical protein